MDSEMRPRVLGSPSLLTSSAKAPRTCAKTRSSNRSLDAFWNAFICSRRITMLRTIVPQLCHRYQSRVGCVVASQEVVGRQKSTLTCSLVDFERLRSEEHTSEL